MGEKIIEIEREGDAVVVRFHRQFIPRMPAGVRQHARAAGREVLMALRNMIDVAVEYSEAKDKAA
ncbi:MAG: hypothetical protein HYY32_05630, partial [Chloroflexi bacterium]|nr:hypothetical protein [Chloroflexota bacterium]